MMFLIYITFVISYYYIIRSGFKEFLVRSYFSVKKIYKRNLNLVGGVKFSKILKIKFIEIKPNNTRENVLLYLSIYF